MRREHLEDVAGPLDMDEQILPALQHRHQRGGVEAGQQHVLAAPGVGPTSRDSLGSRTTGSRSLARSRAAADEIGTAKRLQLGRFAQRVAEQDMGRGARAAGVVGAGLAQLDELEAARAR